jgi:hypothetical protein
MGRVKLSVAGRKSKDPVVLHLDRAVAHDLLQALTQALEPHPGTGKLAKDLLKGGFAKGAGLKSKSRIKGQSAKKKGSKGNTPNRNAAKGKNPKGSGQKKSR